MKSRILGLVAVALVAAFSLGCGSTHVYNGPVANRLVVTTDAMKHLDTVSGPVPSWKTVTVLHISNPSDKRDMNVLLDCEIKPQAQFNGLPPTGGTREHLQIAKRTTQDVLLDPKDGVCLVAEE